MIFTIFQAASQYRGAVRGICGTYSNQYADDFTSPKNCIMSNPQYFTAAYAFIDSSSPAELKSQRDHAEQGSCAYKTYLAGNYVSRNEGSNGYKYYKYNNSDKYYESAYKNSKYYDASRYNYQYNPYYQSQKKYARNEDNSYSSSSSSSSSSDSSSSSSSMDASYYNSYEQRNQNGPSIHKLYRVMNEGEKTCFSVNAIPTCRYPYKPQGGAYKEVIIHV